LLKTFLMEFEALMG